MHTDQAPKEKPTGSANSTAGHTDSVIVSDAIEFEKEYSTLRAQFALAGHELTRTDRADGAVSYYASRWGLVRHLGSLDEAREFLTLIGGRHEL